MNQKQIGLALAAILLASLVGSVAVVGNVAAQTTDTPTPTPTDTPTATPTDVGPLADETVDVDNDTNAVQALVENTTGELAVTVYGVDADGNETQVASGTLNAAGADATDTYKYSSLDPTAYTSYRLVVDGDGAELVEVAKVQTIAVGGGFAGTGMSPLIVAGGGLALIVAIGAAALWGRQ